MLIQPGLNSLHADHDVFPEVSIMPLHLVSWARTSTVSVHRGHMGRRCCPVDLIYEVSYPARATLILDLEWIPEGVEYSWV